MTRDDVIRLLRADNPRARADVVAVYADAFLEYHGAQANIAEHGSVVFHPKTGAPIENPYLPVRDKASKVMRDIRLRIPERLWPTSSTP